MPCYQGLSQPKLSEGWITRFKNRHNLRQRTKHGEAGSADNSGITTEIMEEIREATKSYNPDDIYIMDETDFWKMVPDRSLGTERTSGLKQDKARVARYGEEREAESDEEIQVVAKVSVTEALSALSTLKTYEEQQSAGDSAFSKALRTRERELRLTKQAGTHQGSLDNWIGKTSQQ